MLPELFLKYAKIFSDNGYFLYMVGGSSRDYLLGKAFIDYDFVTDATPQEIKDFLPSIDLTFSKYGSIRIKGEDFEIDVTTCREEGSYKDCRHPSYIKLIKDIQTDSNRRDFTINAIYIDKDENIFDFHGGLEDLKNHIIKFIGDPIVRINEDPLRILRAERFSKLLNFEIEKKSLEAINSNKKLLDKLNPEKIKFELQKSKERK